MMENIQDDTISCYFPKKYPINKRQLVIQDLSNLLNSEKTYHPALIMEYILFQMINSKIEYCIDNKTSTIAMLPAAEREYLLEIFKKEYDTYEEALEILENLEDLQAYPDFLFEDYDFNLLDEMSEEELFHSPLNKLLDIGSIEFVIYVPGKINFS
ncbi:hypothetical protein [Sporofaciens sp. SGI.106]|uniref:hypothetical protein n=1 Tax=Sporofaciens sp. SGI.106 TaxID=3420568 RepID=UPI003D041482